MIVNDLMGGGPGLVPTAMFVLVIAVILAGLFVWVLVRTAFGLLAGGSSGRGSSGFAFFMIFFGLAALGILYLYQNATHLMS